MLTDGNQSDVDGLSDEDDTMEDKDWDPAAHLERSASEEEQDEEETPRDPEPQMPDLTDLTPPPTQTEGEQPATSQQSTRKGKQTRKGQVKRKYKWKKRRFVPPDDAFVECADDELDARAEFTEMIELVTFQTNLYSIQKDGRSIGLTPEDTEKILGMYLHMGLVQEANVRAYWEAETRYDKVADVMIRDRFLKFLTIIHFEDNEGNIRGLLIWISGTLTHIKVI